MQKGYVGLLLGALLAACGGDEAAPPPAAPPPPPPMAATPPPAPPSTAAAPTPAKPTTAEMFATMAKAATESINAHDAKKFAMGFSDDGVWNIVGMPELKGRAEIEKQMQGWFDAFKDIKFAFSRAWIKGDVAVYEWAWTGTNTGEFMGAKATEKPAGLQGLSVVWLNTADGTIKRNNHYADMPTLMTQLSGKGKARPVPTLAANMETFTAKGTPEEDKNLEVWKTMTGAFESKKEADFMSVVADDTEWNDMTMPESMKGKDSAKKFFGMFTKAFPDMKFQATTTMGVGDYAIAESTFTGTQKGALPGIPAKNKPVTMHGVDIVQVKDGKVAKGWTYGNNAEMLMQLGMMKPPAAPKAAAPAGDKKPAGAAAPAGDKKPAGAAAPAGDKKPAAEKKPAEKK
jgi:steroid delta-isomerase-like uncharacterized protein